MSFRHFSRLLSAALVVVLTSTALVSAQQAVTFTMRNGDNVPVTLVDLKAAGFEVEVRGSARMIPKDQVAMVNFGGNVQVRQSWFNDMTSLDHLVVFKNGDTLLTEWVDVGGRSPLILRVKTNRGERELSSADVARIYLVKPTR